MKILKIDFERCLGRHNCPIANKHILDIVVLDGQISICDTGWADTPENNALFRSLKANCPNDAVKVSLC